MNSAEPTDSIILGGKRFKLAGGVKVVTYEDNPSWSFEAMASPEVPVMTARRHPETRLKCKTVEDLAASVNQVLIHTDMTRSSEMCFKVLLDRDLSTHFMINWDGTIYQGMDPINMAYHAGLFNEGSIGVDMNSRMRNLERDPDEPAYDPKSRDFAKKSDKAYRRGSPVRKRINGFWTKAYGYTDPQYQSLLSLLSVLTSELDIPPVVPMDEKREIIPTMLPDAAGFKGILGHYHITLNRWDPGPAFDWNRIQAGLAREHNAFPIALRADDNISNLLEKKRVEAYAALYHDNIERNETGGWYPIGINQNWHGGVHLHAPRPRQPVMAMFDGVIVAARFSRTQGPLGDHNFIVLRHEVPIPSLRKGTSNTLVFYSLTMHLAWMDVANPSEGEDDVAWVGKLSAVTEEEEDASPRRVLDEEEDTEINADARTEDEEREEARYDPDDVKAQVRLLDRILKTGNRAAFEREQIALIPWRERPLKVRSGDTIGYVGEFGPGDDAEPMVHVEIFADKGWDDAIDMGVHRRFFIELEPDLSRDLFVNNAQILALFSESRRRRAPSMVPKRVISPETLADFFSSDDPSDLGAKRNLRMTITRHVSEWSDQVDWVQSLLSSEAWGEAPEDWTGSIKRFKKIVRNSGVFREALMHVLPYTWLNRDVAQHIGLDVEEWNGVLYHFHPIHFLLWLTYHSSQRIQVISKGLSLKQLKRRRARQRTEEAREKESGDRHACEIAAVDLVDVEGSDYRGQLDSLVDVDDQGEWKLDWEEE